MQEFFEARFQPRVAVDEINHFVCVPGDNYHQVVAVILHLFEQCVNRFLTEVIIAARLRESIGLVNKQHAAKSFFDFLLRFSRCLAYKLSHKVGTVDFDNLLFFQETEIVINFCNDPCHRGFSCSGVAGENHMHRYGRCFLVLLFALLLVFKKLNHLLHILLH